MEKSIEIGGDFIDGDKRGIKCEIWDFWRDLVNRQRITRVHVWVYTQGTQLTRGEQRTNLRCDFNTRALVNGDDKLACRTFKGGNYDCQMPIGLTMRVAMVSTSSVSIG